MLIQRRISIYTVYSAIISLPYMVISAIKSYADYIQDTMHHGRYCTMKEHILESGQSLEHKHSWLELRKENYCSCSPNVSLLHKQYAGVMGMGINVQNSFSMSFNSWENYTKSSQGYKDRALIQYSVSFESYVLWSVTSPSNSLPFPSSLTT